MAKTLRSRVAAVAVAALGVGLLQATPAFADAAVADEGAVSSVAAYAPIGRVDSEASIVVKVTAKADPANAGETLLDADDLVNLAARFVVGGKPTGSALTNASLVGKKTAYDALDTLAVRDGTTTGKVYEFLAKSANTTSGYAKFTFTPDVAGAYSILIWNDKNGDGVYQSAEASVSTKVTTAGAPTKITVTNVGGDSIANAGYGALLKVSLTDSTGAATTLADGEILALTSSSEDAEFYNIDNSTTITELSKSDFTRGGKAYFEYYTEDAGTYTAKISGDGDLPVTLVTSIAVKFVEDSIGELDAWNDYDSVAFSGSAGVDGFDDDNISLAAQTRSFKVTIATAEVNDDDAAYVGVNVIDLKANILDDPVTSVYNGGDQASGSYGMGYTKAVTIAATKTSGTFSVTFKAAAAASGSVATVGSIDVDRVAPVASAVDTDGAFLTLIGGTVTVTATLLDQFGNALADYPLALVFGTGRNGGANNINKVTNADGEATFTFKDASITASSLTDSLSFTSGTATPTGTVDITYTAAFAGTVTVDASTTEVAINTSKASSGSTTITFTVLDANSAPVAGAAIAVAGTSKGAGVVTGYETVFTAADGTAEAEVYSSATGAATFTGTVAIIGKTATATRTFVNTAADAKVLTVSVAGSIVSAKVTDNYGNPVPYVWVEFSRTGNVTLNTSFYSQAVTNKAGVAEMSVSGTGTVTASLDKTAYPQSTWLAGYLGAATTATASTTAVAGVGVATVTVTGAQTPTEVQVAALQSTVIAMQTAISTLVASTTATLTAMAASIKKIMTKLKIK